MMKSIVHIYFGRDPGTGMPYQGAPFFVVAEGRGRSGVYEDEADVIAPMYPEETEATFEAEWVHGGWVFGKRVLDA